MTPAQQVVAMLAQEGVEACPEDIERWAETMVERRLRLSGVKTRPEDWIQGALVGHRMACGFTLTVTGAYDEN